MVDLHLSCEVKDNALELTYKITNRGTTPLIAFDGTPGKPDLTGQVEVGLGTPEEVRILRVLPKPPGGMSVDAVRTPNVSQTPPGQSRTVTFQLALPLRERNQFTPDFPGATYNSHQVQQVTLILGYFWKTGNTVLKAYPDHPDVFQVVSGAGPEQRSKASARCSVELMVRTDNGFVRPE